VGDPFTAKSLIEATLEVCRFPELIGLQDLGAGGLSTAPAEMAARGGVGIALDIEEVPLRDPTMTPYEILLSESQERMVLCVKAGSEQKFLNIFRKWGLEAAVIGEVIAERVYRIRHEGRTIAEVPIELSGRRGASDAGGPGFAPGFAWTVHLRRPMAGEGEQSRRSLVA
jgi:phosphoribosylformylglycinamidine (FGAM) synthase-like enzyme